MSDILHITALGNRGEGVAEGADGRIYVPFTLPGEVIEAAIEGTRATMTRLVAASPERIAPVCAHFGTCGGCQLQHWHPDSYRAWKRDRLVDQLARVGLEAPVAPLIEAHGAGRRRATLHASEAGAGFTALRSHAVHPLETCPILVPALAKAPEIARALATHVGPCDVAFTATDSGLDVAIKGKPKTKSRPDLAAIARRHDLARIALNGDVHVQRRPVRQQIGRAVVDLPVQSFLQATAMGEEVLADQVLKYLGKAKKVADLFCGLGPFALRIAERAKVFAADSDKAAVAACDAALQATPGLKRIGTETRDLFDDPLLAEELNRFDAVVFDPPRAGAAAQARELARSRAKTVIAVSCDLASFARDARILVDGGYRLEQATPVDQFLYTAHVETVARFAR